MKSIILSGVAAVALISLSVLPSAAITIPLSAAAASGGTSIGLGTSDFQSVTKPTAGAFDGFFNFVPTGALTFSANSTETTSCGTNCVNPFSISLFAFGNPTALASSSTIIIGPGSETVSIANVALLAGVSYYVEVSGTTLVSNVGLDGNVTLTATPLPGALALFGSGILGMWGWTRKRRNQQDQALLAA
jgi:hypothetical protein